MLLWCANASSFHHAARDFHYLPKPFSHWSSMAMVPQSSLHAIHLIVNGLDRFRIQLQVCCPRLFAFTTWLCRAQAHFHNLPDVCKLLVPASRWRRQMLASVGAHFLLIRLLIYDKQPTHDLDRRETGHWHSHIPDGFHVQRPPKLLDIVLWVLPIPSA